MPVLPRVEDELVLLCARARIDAQTSGRIRDIASSQTKVDWEYVYGQARRHAILPLVYTHLSSIAADIIPVDQLARLKEKYQSNAARNVLLTAELCHILETFEGAGIEAVPYKGPALAVYAYENLLLRRFVDLDILVRKADVLRAKEALEAEGFVCSTSWTSAQQALLLRTQHNLALSREAGRLVVELHWEVASGLFASSLQAEEFWGRLGTMLLNNVTVRNLAAEDLLLSLCVHGAKHLWERLAWICDVAQVIKTQEIDWSVLIARSGSTANQRMLFLGVHLANKLLGAPLPEHVRGQIEQDRIVLALANEVSNRLFYGAGFAPVSFRENFKFNWSLRTNWRARLRYCQLMFQPSDADIEKMAFPRQLTFVYYLLRPFGLLKRDRQRREAVSRDRLNVTNGFGKK